MIAEGRGFTEAIVVDGKGAAGAATGHTVFVRRRQWAAGELAGRRRTRRTGGTDRSPAQRPKPSVHGGIAFLPALAACSADRCRGRARGPGSGQPGRQADFDVWVVDDRHQYANRDRFPTAQELLVGPIEEVLATSRSLLRHML